MDKALGVGVAAVFASLEAVWSFLRCCLSTAFVRKVEPAIKMEMAF
jgi:hypothetical protein